MTQTIDKEINDYIHLLNVEQKQSILSMLKSFTTPKTKKKRISIEQYNKEMDEAEKEVESGKWIDHDDVKKLSASW